MATDAERKSQTFYAAHEYIVVRVTGWDCGPEHPGSWWCPELGYTLTEGCQLFDTFEAARDKALADIAQQRVKLNKYEAALLRQEQPS